MNNIIEDIEKAGDSLQNKKKLIHKLKGVILVLVLD